MSEPTLPPVVERAVQELRALPPVAAGTVERVAAAAVAARRDDNDDVLPVAGRRRWLAYAGIAVAACVVGYAARGLVHTASVNPTGATSVAGTPAAPGVQLASNADAAAQPLAWQFVFHGEHAHRVAVVGDFNGWNPHATPLARADGSGLWSVTVPLMPGRHTYAFMVDDTVFMLDPLAPVSRDPDLGSRESVVVVERP
ncbi:MAG TPA: hypothetical protein VF737_00245 [Gemmatimonadaceae bacterium]